MTFNEESYQQKLLEAFGTIGQGLLKSRHPEFYRKIAIHAWNHQIQTDVRRKKNKRKSLSLACSFYVYALLDPRKKGPYIYTILGREIIFPFEPFYIGKGTKDRIQAHVRDAKKSSNSNSDFKGNLIRKLLSEKLKPIELQLSPLEIECVAFVKEHLLIKGIGRRALGEGPLTNATDGKEGASGALVSKETREKKSNTLKGRPWSAARRAKAVPTKKARANMSKGQRRRTDVQIRTEEQKEHLSRINTGKKLSEKVRKAISEGMKGRIVSGETRRKISEAQKGKARGPMPEEQKKKISTALKGRPKSNESTAKAAESNRGRRRIGKALENIRKANGKPMKDSTKRKISASKSGQIQSSETCQKRSLALKVFYSSTAHHSKGKSRSKNYKKKLSSVMKEWWAKRKKEKRENHELPSLSSR